MRVPMAYVRSPRLNLIVWQRLLSKPCEPRLFQAVVPGRFKVGKNSGDGFRNMFRAVRAEARGRFRGSRLLVEALVEALFGRYSSKLDG